MEIIVKRILNCKVATFGMLSVDDQHECFSLEDEYRAVKVVNETRIPAGRYQILLRPAGGMHKRYSAKFNFHRGMFWLQNVPGFEWIYIHIGNREDQTSGCILVGKGIDDDNGQRITKSVKAYKALAAKIHTALDNGEDIWITVEDSN